MSLSDEVIREGDYVDSEDDEVFRKQDVKKAVLELKEELLGEKVIDPADIEEIIDKIFGEKLVSNQKEDASTGERVK